MATQSNSIDWEGLAQRYNPQVVSAVKERVLAASSLEIHPDMFPNLRHEAEEITALLTEISSSEVIEKKIIQICPIEGCLHSLDEEEIRRGECSHCKTNFEEADASVSPKVIFIQKGPLRRIMPWVIAIHGMNTTGAWQEDLSWRVTSKFYYHAPVFIYKYGLTRLEVLFRNKHRALVKDLGLKIRTSIAYAKRYDIHSPPDVIVHSFGSLLDPIFVPSITEQGEVAEPNFPYVLFVLIPG